MDIGVLDFSKAFDTVPHPHLLKKLKHLGIRGDLYHWLTSFLTERDQRVVMEGSYSNFVHVDSGIPQGTVLGPLLFLCHINDLPLSVDSKIRLFADDCLIYREINSIEDEVQLQKDLDSLHFIKHDYSYDSSVSQMLKDLDLSSLENRRKMNKLTLLYKIRNNLCIKENGYLERADSRTRDASRNYKLKSAKSELYKHSFFINTPKIWNKLPSVIKDIQSLEHFKTTVRQHYQ